MRKAVQSLKKAVKVGLVVDAVSLAVQLALVGTSWGYSAKVDKYQKSDAVEQYRIEMIDTINDRYENGQIEKSERDRLIQSYSNASKAELADAYYVVDEGYQMAKDVKEITSSLSYFAMAGVLVGCAISNTSRMAINKIKEDEYYM